MLSEVRIYRPSKVYEGFLVVIVASPVAAATFADSDGLSDDNEINIMDDGTIMGIGRFR